MIKQKYLYIYFAILFVILISLFTLVSVAVLDVYAAGADCPYYLVFKDFPSGFSCTYSFSKSYGLSGGTVTTNKRVYVMDDWYSGMACDLTFSGISTGIQCVRSSDDDSIYDGSFDISIDGLNASIACYMCSGQPCGSVYFTFSPYVKVAKTISFSDIANVDYSYSLDGSSWTAADGKSFEFEESDLPMDIYLRPDTVSDMYTFITFTSTSGKLSHTDYSNMWKYTISSLEDVTISGDAQKHKLLTVAESSEYTFEFKILGDSVIPDTDWISNTDGVDHSYPFLGNFNMLIRNVSISYGLVLSSFQMSSSGNLLYTQDDEGVYTLLAEDSDSLNDLTTIYIQTAPFTLKAYPLFTFVESDDFNGYPILSSMRSENLAVEISSFPWSPEDMTGAILDRYNLLLFSYDIPYWVFEDGSMCTFPLELDEAVQHTSIKPYVSSIRYNPYSMLDMNSSIRAYLVYRDIVNDPPDSLTLSQAMELIDTYSLVALRSPLYYTAPEYVYLCFNSSFPSPYFDISFNGSVICSKQIYSYAYSTSTTYLYYYPLQSLIEASTELFGSASRAKEKLLTLNYISIDTEDGISGDEIHIVLHFDESNIWNPDMLDAFYFFSTIFKGVISALDVYIAPNMTLLSVFTVVLALGILFFVFKIAGIF